MTKNKKIKLVKLGALKNLTNLQPHLRAQSIEACKNVLSKILKYKLKTKV